MSTDHKRVVFLTLIMVVACASIISITMIILYDIHIEEVQARLVVTAQSQARLMEAVARFDAVYSKDYPGGSEKATLSQIINAHRDYKGFGETGEFTLAKRQGDFIVFLFRHRHDTDEIPEPIPIDKKLAEPMQKALSGPSGTIIGLDYRGEMVLAAHEPVAVLNLGIVAKIDLAEVRAPFVKAGLTSVSIAVLIIFIGIFLFVRIGGSMVRKLELYSQNMEKDIKEQKLAEEKLREINKEQQIIFDSVPASIWIKDTENKILKVNRAGAEYVGMAPEDIVGKTAYELFPDEADHYYEDDLEVMKSGKPKLGIVEQLQISSGEKIWVQTDKVPYRDEQDNITGLIVFVIDITNRKKAEIVIKEMNQSLEEMVYVTSHDLQVPLISMAGQSF